jgi:hypothetical protein
MAQTCIRLCVKGGLSGYITRRRVSKQPAIVLYSGSYSGGRVFVSRRGDILLYLRYFLVYFL